MRRDTEDGKYNRDAQMCQQHLSASDVCRPPASFTAERRRLYKTNEADALHQHTLMDVCTHIETDKQV